MIERNREKPIKFISEQEAMARLNTGEWITDLKLNEILGTYIQNNYEWLFRKQAINNERLIKIYQEIYQEILEYFVNNFESYNIERSLDEFLRDPNACVRVSANTVIKINPTLKAVSLRVGGFGTGIFILNLFFGATIGASLPIIREILQPLLQIYEKLENPNEQLVFETIHRLKHKLVVVNYAAYEKENFEKAFGLEAPAYQMLEKELISQMTSTELTNILYELKRRNVLQERDGKWDIVF